MEFNYPDAIAYLHKLGISDSDMEALFLIGRRTDKNGSLCESKEHFIRMRAAYLSNYGRTAVHNSTIKKDASLSEIEKLVALRDQTKIELEESFLQKFHIAFVKNSKYSIPITLKGEKYEVIVPKTIVDLIKEGLLMHNCLVDRAYWMALGTMKFFFIRKKNDINTPLMDVVLTQDNKILWAITKYHENIKGDNEIVFKKWFKTCFGHIPTKKDYVPRQDWFSI